MFYKDSRLFLLMLAMFLWSQTSFSEGDRPLSYRPTILPQEKLGFTAEWQICNKSNVEKVRVSYIYQEKGSWIEEGWKTIPRGKCQTLLSKLDSEFVYYYAEDINYAEDKIRKRQWKGNTKGCANPSKSFRKVVDQKECPKRFKSFDYIEVYIGKKEFVTMDLE